MRRSAKPAKAKVATKPPIARKSRKSEDSRVHELEKRLEQALEQQTATAEILRVISSSPTDIQPVLDAVAASAARLCEAFDAVIRLRRGDELLLAAHHGPIPTVDTISVARGLVAGRAVLERRMVHIPDQWAEAEQFPEGREIARRLGFRTSLTVPLLREGTAIGTILIRRPEVRPFTYEQIALLQIFADQAVIAIENVRLFKELESRNKDLTEALEQQTATSDILKVIASTPTDLTPVFETILRSAVRLFNAYGGSIRRFDGELVHLAAVTSPNPEADDRLRRMFPHPPDREYATERPILDGTVAHIPDTEDEPSELTRRLARDFGFRRLLGVPMLREGQIVGVINVTGSEPGPYSARQIALLQTFADQAVIAIENVRLFTELEEKNRALTDAHAQVSESLEQQTATAEILSVISGSPTDIRPVFDAVLDRALTLCEASDGSLYQLDDGALYHVGARGIEASTAVGGVLSLESVSGRAVLEKRTVHIEDVLQELDGLAPEVQVGIRRAGTRTLVAVPLLREQTAIGAIVIRRLEVRPFSEKQIRLLQTFADQAVIAIENVRLFNETKEALEQQTATNEILRVISQSPTDVQPVFDAIVASATPLCEADFSGLYQFDGALIHFAAHYGRTPEEIEAARQAFPQPLGRASVSARAILACAVIQVADLSEDPEVADPLRVYRTVLSVPMIRGDRPIGAITVARRVVRPFTDKQIELLQTFADQAVIAIENVRLFSELQEKNRALTQAHAQVTETLQQQTATSEILRVISSSPTDLRPVFDTIVRSAARLCNAATAAVFRVDAGMLYHPANYGGSPEALAATRARYPRPLDRETAAGTAILTRSVFQAPDTEDPSTIEHVRQTGRLLGVRSVVSVPMLREGEAVGAIVITRRESGRFSDAEVELVKTFADQAVIAIENVRLFKELEVANRELEAASQHKSEFLANMSHELRTPLNAIIGFSEVLTERMFGELNEKQEEYLKDIYASGTHLLSLINDILDLSKIEAGRMELELTDFDLPTALDNALTLVRERAARRGLTLEKSVDERLGQIRADERKIRQVALNVLSNAIKFTPEGGRIEVRAVPVDGSVEVSVSDTGVGIAPEDQEAVFEEFRQVGTSAAKQEGTGLGLALCRKFVELHGGRIWVTSQVGVGSTFTFTIPVRRSE